MSALLVQHPKKKNKGTFAAPLSKLNVVWLADSMLLGPLGRGTYQEAVNLNIKHKSSSYMFLDGLWRDWCASSPLWHL